MTFTVTAITVWIPPLSRIHDGYHEGVTPQPEEKVTGDRLGTAWREAKLALHEVPSFWTHLWSNLRDGIYMAAAILPTILSVGLIGLLVAKHTPVFDWLGWLFVPFTWATRMVEPVLAGKAVSLGIVEMFLPAGGRDRLAGHPLRHRRGVGLADHLLLSRWCPASWRPTSRRRSGSSSSSGSNASC